MGLRMAPQGFLGRWARWTWTIGVIAGGAAALGCTADPPRDEGASAQGRAALADWETKKLAWGSGPAQVGLRPAATELPAEGPSSVAVGPSGDVVILDRLNERLLAIGLDGAVRAQAQVARDVEHVAIA